MLLGCREGGNVYHSGEKWKCSDGCNTWYIYAWNILIFIINELTQFYVYSWCYLGRVFSTKKLCIPPGSCQLDDGTIVKNGETVFPNTPCIGMYEYIIVHCICSMNIYSIYIYTYIRM